MRRCCVPIIKYDVERRPSTKMLKLQRSNVERSNVRPKNIEVCTYVLCSASLVGVILLQRRTGRWTVNRLSETTCEDTVQRNN